MKKNIHLTITSGRFRGVHHSAHEFVEARGDEFSGGAIEIARKDPWVIESSNDGGEVVQ